MSRQPTSLVFNVPVKEAAKLLGCTTETVNAYRRQGWIEGRTRSGETGEGQRYYYDRGQLEAFLTGQAPGARAYKESLETMKPKKGRRPQPA